VPVRLAIVGLPKLLADIIAAAFTDDDNVRVDQLPDEEAVDLTDGDQPHDVIVVGVSDPWSSPLLNQFNAATNPTLLGVRTDGRDSWIYRMQPFPHRLGPASPAQIRAAVLSDPRAFGNLLAAPRPPGSGEPSYG
jgi:hypothetical protein